MALFPNISNEFLDPSDHYIRQRMEHFYTEHSTQNLSFQGEADVDTRFYCGDQTVFSDMYGTTIPGRKRNFVFNRIRRVVDMVSGYQRRNRKSTLIVPRENADQETADQLTKVLMWAYDRENVDESISRAFQNAMISGMTLLQVWQDFRVDPVSGNLRISVCNYNSFLIDTYFSKQDLSDCNGIWRRSFITKPEALTLLPGHEKEIMSISSYTNEDGKFQYMPQYYGYDMKNLLTYDEFYYRTFRPQKVLVDRKTGETLQWRGEGDVGLRDFLAYFPEVTVIETEVPTVHLAVVLQGKLMYEGPNPAGIDSYPFVPVMGYFHPELPYYPFRIQGMVRGLRDAQYLYNRRLITSLDIFESVPNSGWLFKENALVDPADVYLTGQGRGIALKEEAAMTDVQPIVPPQVPPSMLQLSEALGNEVNQISGVNEELLGSAVDDKAGILSMLRQGAGLTTLQTLFDQLDVSCKMLGRLCVELIQANFTPGKVSRIVEGEASPVFNNKAFGIYDAVVEEGFNTATQRQVQFGQMLQLREVGVPISDEDLISAATLQNKNELINRMQQQKMQQAEQALAMQQVQIQEMQARTELAKARSVADQGLGLERLSRIAENQALAQERKAEAQRDDAAATLDMVKAMQEIEGVDLANLEKVLALARMLQESRPLEPSAASVGRGAPPMGQNLATEEVPPQAIP